MEICLPAMFARPPCCLLRIRHAPQRDGTVTRRKPQMPRLKVEAGPDAINLAISYDSALGRTARIHFKNTDRSGPLTALTSASDAPQVTVMDLRHRG
jgi:hypothetical protein